MTKSLGLMNEVFEKYLMLDRKRKFVLKKFRSFVTKSVQRDLVSFELTTK